MKTFIVYDLDTGLPIAVGEAIKAEWARVETAEETDIRAENLIAEEISLGKEFELPCSVPERTSSSANPIESKSSHFDLAYAQTLDITKVQIAKQPNTNMALITSFTGTSPRGDLTEAIQKALDQARPNFKKKIGWTILETSGDQLKLGSISVTIRVGKRKGDGGGTGPHGHQ